MTVFGGDTGGVVWNAEDDASDIDLTSVISWECDVTADVAEITAMRDTWKTYLGGHAGWTGEITCNLLDTGPEIPFAQTFNVISIDGLGDAYEIDVSGDPTTQKVFIEWWFGDSAGDGILYGPAIATAISIALDVNDVMKVTYSIQGNGELLYKTTAPADFEEPLS